MPPNCLTRRPVSARLYSWPGQPEIEPAVSRWPQTRRPFTIAGEMRMKWPPDPGTHDVSATRSRQPISSASVTARACPTMVTLQPACASMSTVSASNATTAPRVAAASFPSALVLTTMSPSIKQDARRRPVCRGHKVPKRQGFCHDLRTAPATRCRYGPRSQRTGGPWAPGRSPLTSDAQRA
jgi:hypothetical protein